MLMTPQPLFLVVSAKVLAQMVGGEVPLAVVAPLLEYSLIWSAFVSWVLFISAFDWHAVLV